MNKQSLPEVLASNPPLLKAASAALKTIKTTATAEGASGGITREADKLRQAIARARVITRKRVRTA